MTFQRIKAMLDEKPFRPFEISTSDGKSVTVLHPDFAWIHPSRRTMYVCPDPNVDADAVIDLLHITQLAYGKRNGKGRRGKKK